MTDKSDSHIPEVDSEFDTSLEESAVSQDNDYTELDEVGYVALDEENDREVASRGGIANYTQNVDAELPENEDDAEVREGELPVQPRDTLSDS